MCKLLLHRCFGVGALVGKGEMEGKEVEVVFNWGCCENEWGHLMYIGEVSTVKKKIIL